MDNRSSSFADAPPLLIGTPFGIGVKDKAWFDHRLILTASITAPSLLAQDDPNFFWGVFTDSDLPSDIQSKLEELLAPFRGRAAVYCDRQYNSASLLAIAQDRGAVDANGRLFTARIDDDDAWNGKMVGMARNRVRTWSGFSDPAAAGLGFTFADGLEWIMYDMVDVDVLQRKGQEIKRSSAIRSYQFPFLGTSVFVLSGPQQPLSAISAGHARMGEVLASRGHDVEVVASEQPMWLYCRHKQAESALQKARGQDVTMTLTDLAKDFGLDERRTASYLANASDHQYVIVKRIKRRRGELVWKLRQLHVQLKDPSLDPAQDAQLRKQEQEIVAELAEVSDDLLGAPDALASRDSEA